MVLDAELWVACDDRRVGWADRRSGAPPQSAGDGLGDRWRLEASGEVRHPRRRGGADPVGGGDGVGGRGGSDAAPRPARGEAPQEGGAGADDGKPEVRPLAADGAGDDERIARWVRSSTGWQELIPATGDEPPQPTPPPHPPPPLP